MRRQSIHLTYLFFNGSREEAVEFYRNAFRAEVETMMRDKDRRTAPVRHGPPEPPRSLRFGMIPKKERTTC
jgi:uncharacterized glyoxalase superfamily protein PhnB